MTTSQDPLADHERRVISAARTGQMVDLRVGHPDRDDPAHGASWNAARTVHADLLIDLLTAEPTPDAGRPRAVKIQGARITGPLDLEACTLACPLLLRGCHIDEPINLNEATATAIRLPGCHIPGLSAQQLRTTGDLELNDSFTATGEVNLLSAHIGGYLNLTSAQLTNPNGRALAADGLAVDQGMFGRGGFTAEGEIRLIGARIGGQLDLTGAQLTNLNGPALNAYRLTIDLDMFCSEGFTAKGEVRLVGTQIGGHLVLDGAQLTNPNGPALSADGLAVDQGMFGRGGFTAEGEIRLIGARIGGQLELHGAQLTNPNGPALNAYQLTVNQHMFCTAGFTAKGEIRLVGARIDGQLDLTSAQLTNPAGRTLSADQLIVNQGMFCTAGFTSEGEINLIGAHIGAQLVLDGAHLTNPNGPALSADQLTADQGMFCMEGFTTDGEIRLLNARIGGQLALNGAHLTSPNGVALTADGLTVDRGMFCMEGFTAEGEVRLVNAHIDLLALHGAHLTNPNGPALNADGLTVDQHLFCVEGFTAEGEMRLVGARIGGQLALDGATLNNPEGTALNLQATRMDHLSLRPAHRPNGAIDLTNAQVGSFDDDAVTWPIKLLLCGFTYETLENDQASVRDRLRWLTLHPGGYVPQIYDQLAIAYRRAGQAEAARKVGVAKQLRRRSNLNPFNWLLYLTVGYGYRTWLAGVWLAALTLIGAPVFARAYPHHMTQATPKAPAFHPLAYTLDVLLPIVDLGQEKAWTPQGWTQTCTWVLIAAGWFLTTAAAAGLTGIFKRD